LALTVVESGYLVVMSTTPATGSDALAREVWGAVSELWISQRPRINAELAGLGLHPMQALALRLLQPGEPGPMSALASRLHCDASNVTNIADRLEAAGLIERRADEHDRRVKTLALTARGEEVRARIADIWHQPPAAFADLPVDDLLALRDIVARALGRDG
jgi:DNA-binding MarR family transcriptional regulator